LPNFTPIGVTIRVQNPKSEIFTEVLPRFGIKKCPSGAYPLGDFHENCNIRTQFQYALNIKTWMDFLKGLRSYGDFKYRASGFPPKFQRLLAANLCVRSPDVLTAQERARGSLSPCQGWWYSDFTSRWGGQNVEFLSVCLSVCSSRF